MYCIVRTLRPRIVQYQNFIGKIRCLMKQKIILIFDAE